MVEQRNMKRCLKKKLGITNLILKDNIQLNDIAAMQHETLIGRFVNKMLYANTLRHYTTQTFFLVLGYVPKILVLSKGYMVWTFHSTMDTQKVLIDNWTFGA
jgi:hypothetical protein